MKKFLIAVCGVLIVGNALARGLYIPKQVDTALRDKWGLSPWNYNKDLTGRFMQKSMIGNANRKGACGDNAEGAGVAIIATDIFSNGNGAEFCTRQIQAASNDQRSRIDFYDTKGYKCKVFCKSGWYGKNCDTQTFTEIDYKDYREEFDKVLTNSSLLDTTGKYCDEESKIKTTDTPVFHFEQPFKDSFAQVYVLGVLGVTEHSITVGPVDIQAVRKGYKKSWISSVKGNRQEFTLCAAGYIQSGDTEECVLAPERTIEDRLNKLCADFKALHSKSEYNSSEHETIYDEKNKCYRFRCTQNKGFTSTNDVSCIECPGGALAYLDEYGLCKTCDKGEIVNENRNGCSNATLTKYSRSEMKNHGARECWLETDVQKFLGCIKGCGKNECYSKTGTQCSKDNCD